MNINIILRGQSNAFYLDALGGTDKIERQVEWLLGFDGLTENVNIIAAYNDPTGANTIVGGTSFVRDWMVRNPDGSWAPGPLERGLLAEIQSLPAPDRANPMAVVWLHNETDATIPGLTAADWSAAVRADAALVRGTLGQPAAPYLFVSAIPYQFADPASNQQIKIGMEQLAADPTFKGLVVARINDVNMDFDKTGFGGAHFNTADVDVLADRLTRSIAETFAQYAEPGSLIATVGGDVANLGPQVVAAQAMRPAPGAGPFPTTLLLTVKNDQSVLSPTLDPDAAAGVGWAIQTPNGAFTPATSAVLVDADQFMVNFANGVPAGGVLHYGYGNGRLTGADGSGLGNAVYDIQALPVWTAAGGVAIDYVTIA